MHTLNFMNHSGIALLMKFPLVEYVLKSSKNVHTLNFMNHSGIALLMIGQMLGIQRIPATVLEVSI